MMLDYGVISAFMGRLFRIPSVTNAQGSDVDEVSTWFRKLETLYALKNNRVVTTTNSEFREKLLMRHNRPIQIWPNILDRQLLPKPTSCHLNGNAFHMLAVGRLVRVNGVETKGISHIIEAMKSLEGCHLHILGEGPLSVEYKARIRKLGIEDRVTLHGYQPRETILGFMRAADVLLFPSMTEGLSMTVIEAMLMGLPVITTAVGGQADHIAEGVNGFFVERASSESIVQKVRYISQNRNVLCEISKNAVQHFTNHFSFEAFAKHFQETVLDPTHSPPYHGY
jgi:glycosyltransferase involved in cell wall biosynthesis